MRSLIAPVLLIAAAAPLLAQDPPPPPPPEPAPAQQAPAPDTMPDFTGEWQWGAQLGPEQIGGTWRVNRNASGRYAGVVLRDGRPSAPIRSFNTRGRSFTMTMEWDGEMYEFQGQLENVRAINGTLRYRGGMGRMRAQRRDR